MNSHLFLQYGLRDGLVTNFPYAFWWIHQLPEHTQISFEFGLMHHSHNVLFCRIKQEQLTFPTSYVRSWWFPCSPYPRGRWNKIPRNFLALSRWIFSSAHFCFSFSLAFFHIDFHYSGQRWSGLDVNCFLVNLPPDHVCPSRTFSSSKINCVKPVQGCDKSREPSMFQ